MVDDDVDESELDCELEQIVRRAVAR
jgi:hypothetical protein